MIPDFKRDRDFFFKVAERRGVLRAIDLDNELNKISDYLNNVTVIFLNEFIKNNSIASRNPNDINSFYVDNGDGTASWQKISLNHIEEESLNLNNILLYPYGNMPALIISDENCSLKTLDTSRDNSIVLLIANEDGELTFGNLTSDLIEDNSIKDSHFANHSLEENKFFVGIEKWFNGNNIEEFSLEDKNFTENCFNEKTLSSVFFIKPFIGEDIGVLRNLLYSLPGVGNILSDGCINNLNMFANNTRISYQFLEENFKIPSRLYANKIFDLTTLKPNSIVNSNLKKNEFPSSRLWNSDGLIYPYFNFVIADEAIGLQQLDFTLQQKILAAITP